MQQCVRRPPPSRDNAGPGPLWAELIMSCQQFCWQVFIYQAAATFPRTQRRRRSYEGQHKSRILIKDQAAKNKMGPAGSSLRLKGGNVWGGRTLYVLIITPTRSVVFRINVSMTFFFSAAGAMRDGRRRGGTAAKTDRRTNAGHDVLRGQRWPVDKRCQTCLRTACDCLLCLMGTSWKQLINI